MFGNTSSNDRDNHSFDIIICSQSTVSGAIESAGSVRIDGKLSGDVQCGGNAIIGEQAEIEGNINAQSADIGGHVNGDIQLTGALKLLATADVAGNICAQSLEIDQGARFSGQCTIGEPAKKIALVEDDRSVHNASQI